MCGRRSRILNPRRRRPIVAGGSNERLRLTVYRPTRA